MANELMQSLSVDHKAIDVSKHNLARMSDPNAKMIHVDSITQRKGDLTYNDYQFRVYDDPIVHEQSIKAKSEKSYLEQLQEYYSNLHIENYEKEAGNLSSKNTFKVSKMLKDFITQTAINNDDLALSNELFIDSAQKLTNSINKLDTNISRLQDDASSNLKSMVTNFNGEVKKIHDINKALSKRMVNNHSLENIDLKNESEKYIQSIASFVGLQRARQGEKGQAFVAMENGLNIVEKDRYLQLNVNREGKLEYYYIGITGQKEPTNTEIDKIYNGKIGAALDFINNSSDIKSNVTTMKQALMLYVNKIYNDSSTRAVQSKKLGTTEVDLHQRNKWSGVAEMTLLKSDGKTFKTSDGMRPIKLDFDRLSRLTLDGKLSNAEIIYELDQSLNVGSSFERIVIGQLESTTGDNIAGNYLINNIQAAVDVAPENGKFAFSLDIDGNDYCDVESIEITNIASDVPTDSVVGGVPIKIGKLAQGERLRTDSINFNLTSGPAQHIISATIRVIGKNGKVHTGTLDFTVDTTKDYKSNQRLQCVRSGVAAGNIASGGTFTTVGSARFVDSDGFDSRTTNGYLKIETMNPNSGLVIKSKDATNQDGLSFGQFFGLNNLFVEDKGKIIVSDHVKRHGLSTDVVEKGTEEKDLLVGDKKSSIQVQFNVLNNGNQITIDGVKYTFVDLLTGAKNEILIGAMNVVAQNLQNAITANPLSLVDATVSGDVLTIRAKYAGISGNAINVQAGPVLNDVKTKDVDSPVTAFANLAINTTVVLTGGTDKTIKITKASSKLSTKDNIMGEIAKLDSEEQIFKGEKQKLTEVFEDIGMKFASIINENKTELTTKTKEDEILTKRFHEISGITKEKLYEVFGEAVRNIRLKTGFIAKWNEVEKQTIEQLLR